MTPATLAWITPRGLTATLVPHPDAGHVAFRLTDGVTHVETLPLAATEREAIDYADAVYVRLGSEVAA